MEPQRSSRNIGLLHPREVPRRPRGYRLDSKDIIFSLRALKKEGAFPDWTDADFKRLTKLAGQTAKKASDPDNWGMSRSIVSGMMREGVDMNNEDQIQRWINNFNNRSFSERDQLMGGPPRVQPVRAGKKYGRNERVTVVYNDGRRKEDVKYKTVLKDLEAGVCQIV